MKPHRNCLCQHAALLLLKKEQRGREPAADSNLSITDKLPVYSPASSCWPSHSVDFSKAETVSGDLGITIPESLDGNAFCNITTGYVVPDGTSYLEALITPAYRWYSVDYGTDRTWSLTFGTTKDDLYHYCFDLDSENVWSPGRLLPGSRRTEEYKGITMQVGTVINYNGKGDGRTSGFIPQVIWVDAENSTVFSLSAPACDESDMDQITDHLTKTAKEIIDINTDG